jgi:adenine-specific DNA-methyltransferase
LDELDDLELLSKDELIDLLRERAEVGVKLTFPGKAMSRRITRRVRPGLLHRSVTVGHAA